MTKKKEMFGEETTEIRDLILLRPGHTKRLLRCDFASRSVALVCFNGVTTPRANSHRPCFLLRSAKNRDAIPNTASRSVWPGLSLSVTWPRDGWDS